MARYLGPRLGNYQGNYKSWTLDFRQGDEEDARVEPAHDVSLYCHSGERRNPASLFKAGP